MGMSGSYPRDSPSAVRIPRPGRQGRLAATLGDVATIVDLIRDRRLDAELAALLWVLAAARVPVHVASPVQGELADAVRELTRDPTQVTDGPGSSIDDVLRLPVPLRPATGAIVILDAHGRVAAAHLLRPPLRDGAGHVRPQGPAVLAARLDAEDRLEHFAWGVMPELAASLDLKAGDVEADIANRAALLDGLAATSSGDPNAVRQALRGWPDSPRRAD
jgi:hypothetical protein